MIAKQSRGEKLLVVSSGADIVDMVRKAVDSSVEVIHAPDEEQGLAIAKKEMPDVIILDYIEDQGNALALYRQLREGWMTKNIPVLLIDLSPQDSPGRFSTVERKLQIKDDEYISISDKGDQAVISQLKEMLKRQLRRQTNLLKEAILNPEVFCITWEQIPGRGAFEKQQETLIENVRIAATHSKIHAVSVTDNPSGNPAISTEMLCAEIKRLGAEPLVHFAFRDKNRNECESLLYGLAAMGVKNLLALTGDYPSVSGFKGRAKPVFDLDSVQGLQLIEMMNAGIEHELMGKKVTLASTDFFTGTAVSPFKQQEAELMGQYYKLKKKIDSGAKFIITQVGYDARKYHELLEWLKINGYDIPVLVNIYLLTYGAGRLMNSNQIPGCVVTDKLLAEIAKEREAPDKGKAARLDRAAKMYAIAKGMGYAGAHIGGHGSTCEMVEYIIDKGEELLPNWQDLVAEFDYQQKNGFYFFQRDQETGLNLDKPSARTAKAIHPFIYLISRLAHVTLFNPNSIIFKLLQPGARFLDSKLSLASLFEKFEHLNKVVLFSCMNCGDCSLFDAAFLCPMSQCPKNQRNGPCGGSYDGWCEVKTDKKCLWVQTYERLKGHKEEDSIGDYIVPPCNWELQGTSSWLNFYLGRDHTAARLGLAPPQVKKSNDKNKASKKEK